LLKKSWLIPQREGQLLGYETYDQHTTEEHKFEFYDGLPFNPNHTYERDRLLIMLLYSCGIDYFMKELLPEQSKEILLQILEKEREDFE
jgi:hypothetical protein